MRKKKLRTKPLHVVLEYERLSIAFISSEVLVSVFLLDLLEDLSSRVSKPVRAFDLFSCRVCLNKPIAS